VSTVLTWTCERLWGLNDDRYRLVYSLVTAFILITSAWIVQEFAPKWMWIFPSTCAAALAYFVTYGYARSTNIDFWIVLIEAVLLLTLGLTLGMVAPFKKERWILVPLSILWLFLAGYDMHFIVNPPIPAIDQFAPTYFISVTSLVCAWFAGSSR
jgi:hypothetical protein